MSGAGSSSRSRKHHDTGEFTDDEDYGIPLEDIREAEFDRLEHTSVAAGTDKSGGATRSLSSWLPWLSKRQQKGSLGDYAQLDEDEGLPTSRRRTTIAPQSTAAPKEWSCDSALGWGIFVFLLIACLCVLVAASMTGYIPNPLSSSQRPQNGTESTTT